MTSQFLQQIQIHPTYMNKLQNNRDEQKRSCKVRDPKRKKQMKK